MSLQSISRVVSLIRVWTKVEARFIQIGMSELEKAAYSSRSATELNSILPDRNTDLASIGVIACGRTRPSVGWLALTVKPGTESQASALACTSRVMLPTK